MNAPVEDGSRDGKALRGGGLIGVDAEWRIQEVLDRLRNSEEHQADADPGREQHGDPRPSGIVRLGVGAAQAYATEGRDHDQKAKKD